MHEFFRAILLHNDLQWINSDKCDDHHRRKVQKGDRYENFRWFFREGCQGRDHEERNELSECPVDPMNVIGAFVGIGGATSWPECSQCDCDCRPYKAENCYEVLES